MTPSENHFGDELELTDYVRILRRRWRWVTFALVVVLGLATTFSLLQAPRYEATAKVSLGSSAAQDAVQGGVLASGAAASRELSNEVDLALGDAVREEVTGLLGEEPAVTVVPEDESDALRFTATAPDADGAALAANTWAQVYVDSKRRQASDSIGSAVEVFETDLTDLREQRQSVRRPLDELEDQLADAPDDSQRAAVQAQLTRAEGDLRPELDLIDARIAAVAESITDLEVGSRLASSGTATVVQVAAPPRQPSNASLARNLVLAAIVGLILGAAAALLAENLDRTIKTADDLSALGLTVLGEIPAPGRQLPEQDLAVAVRRHGDTPVAEAYQKVRTSVEFSLLGRKINSLLVTSANQSEGKTTLAANLAWAMSAVDHRVALVDVDFRRPRIHEVFGCPARPGVADHLLTGSPLAELARRPGDDGGRNLIVLPAGTSPPSPAQLVASPPFTTLIRRVESESDLVILDAPPVLPVSDAAAIGRQVDAVVVVARSGRTTRDQMTTTLDDLRQAGADILGAVLVGRKEAGRGYGYYGPSEVGASTDRRRQRGTTTTTGVGGDRDLDLRGVGYRTPHATPAAAPVREPVRTDEVAAYRNGRR